MASPTVAKTPAAGSPGKAHEEDRLQQTGEDALRGNVEAVRNGLSSMLQVAHGLAAWLELCQRFGWEVTTGWVGTLAGALRDVEHAERVEQLSAIPMQIVQRQVDESVKRAAEAWVHLFETEVQWAGQAPHKAWWMMPPYVPPEAVGAVPTGTPEGGAQMTPLEQVQKEWLALTQRWMDSVSHAAHR